MLSKDMESIWNAIPILSNNHLVTTQHLRLIYEFVYFTSVVLLLCAVIPY